MTDASIHPRHDLNEVIHAPVRLSVMAALASADKLDFRFLRDTVEISDSLLSKHLTTLEVAGYISIIKGHVGRRPRTWVQLTPTGRDAFHEYQLVLRRIVEGAGTSAGPETSVVRQDAPPQTRPPR
jgi:DNA-binding MarR family transcriptional regulator